MDEFLLGVLCRKEITVASFVLGRWNEHSVAEEYYIKSNVLVVGPS